MDSIPVNGNNLKYLDNPDKYKNKKVSKHSWSRQCKTAKQIMIRFNDKKFGQLLADDTGLGKTWVAAICALTFAKCGGRVLVIVPSKQLVPKWKDDINAVKKLLSKIQGITDINIRNTWDEDIGRVKERTVAIITHHEFRDKTYPNLTANLLIVDEAHRSKGELTGFRTKLNERINSFGRSLFLTATPFSIGIGELISTLKLISEDDTDDRWEALRTFDKLCNNIKYIPEINESLKNAIDTLKPWVIRHCVDYLKNEIKEFGNIERPEMEIPCATQEVKEILGRIDRLLNLPVMPDGLRGSDPRFAIGWQHIKNIISDTDKVYGIKNACKTSSIAAMHLKWLENQKGIICDNHQKISTVADAVEKIVQDRQEKVVIFCTHIETQKELVKELRKRLDRPKPNIFTKNQHEIWNKCIDKACKKSPLELRNWAKKPCVRNQIINWYPDEKIESVEQVADLLKKRIRPKLKSETLCSILFNFKALSKKNEDNEKNDSDFSLPGWNSIVTTLESDEGEQVEHRDLFNTPFGPDVLVATNKHSESIDLHKACRILIHYELDPSPVRVKQREGRIRRINGWAKQTGLPVEIYTPFFPGTRDEQLVKIVSERMKIFNLLLGGVRPINLKEKGWEASSIDIENNLMNYGKYSNDLAVVKHRV